MSEMIERVAHVLYDERMRLWRETDANAKLLPDWVGESEAYQNQMRYEARLAIEATREPTANMIDAGLDYDERVLNIKFGRPPTINECQVGEWQAMIDEALK